MNTDIRHETNLSVAREDYAQAERNLDKAISNEREAVNNHMVVNSEVTRTKVIDMNSLVNEARNVVYEKSKNVSWVGYNLSVDITDENETMLGDLLCQGFALNKVGCELYAKREKCQVEVRLTHLNSNGQLTSDNVNVTKYVVTEHNESSRKK